MLYPLVIRDHWEQMMPNKVAQMRQAGTLDQALQQEAQRVLDRVGQERAKILDKNPIPANATYLTRLKMETQAKTMAEEIALAPYTQVTTPAQPNA